MKNICKRLFHRNKKQPKVRRFCKGCWAEVTKDMFCYCGEFPLNESATYTEEELKKLDGYPPKVCSYIHSKRESLTKRQLIVLFWLCLMIIAAEFCIVILALFGITW